MLLLGLSLLEQDREVGCGASAPRTLSLDDYFMTEVEKLERDENGKMVKKTVSYLSLCTIHYCS